MTRTRWLLLVLVTSLAAATALHRFVYFNSTHELALDLADCQSGDLIFRQGKGLWSPYFAGLNSDTGYSHVGVLVKDANGFAVLHADADDVSLQGGVQRTPMGEFLQGALKVEVRHNRMPQATKARFLHQLQAMEQLRLAFDGEFNLFDEGQKVYCTEYIWLAAQRAGVDDFGEVITVAGRSLILVDSFFHSPWVL
jgi:hypothetical protein